MSKFLDKISGAGLRPPKMVTLMMTSDCNLRCRHCWPESGPQRSVQPVAAETFRKLFHELADLQVKEICLTGGEPFTHPQWYTILGDACGRLEFERVTMQTNATLLDDIKIQKLKEIDCKSLVVQVSLEGASSNTHDYVRGEGSFKRALEGLKRLCKAGLGKQTQVAFTEMRHNFTDLPLLLELIDELGISRCVSGTLVPQGRAKKTVRIAPPTSSQYELLLNLYQSDAAFRSRYERLGNIAALEWYRGRSYPSAQGCICIETPYIDTHGRIFPCHYLPALEFAVNGAHDRSLKTVMAEAVALWAKLPVIDRRRRRGLKPCKTCPGRLHCDGGCMGRAWAASGDFVSVEDRCSLRKTVYNWKVQA